MGKRSAALLFGLSVLVSGGIRGESPEINGYLLNQMVVGINTHDTGKSKFLQLHTRFQLRFFKKLSQKANFISIIDFDYFFIDEKIDRSRNILLSNPANSEAVERMFEIPAEDIPGIGIKEAVINLYTGNFEISLGKKITRWGAGDMFNPNDRISPRDEYRMFIQQEEDISRGVYMLDVVYNPGRFSLEFLGMPDFSFVKLPLPGSIWGGDAPLEMSGMPIQNINLKLELPGNRFKNFESAVKLSTHIGKTDLSFYYFNLFVRRPLFKNRVNMSKQEITTTILFKKTHAIGLSLENIFGNIPIRCDLNYIFNEPLSKKAQTPDQGGELEDEIVKKNVLTLCLGSDFELFKTGNLRFYFEFYNSIIFNFEKGLSHYLIPIYEKDHRLFLGLADDYLDENLKVDISAIFFLKGGGGIIRPHLLYNWADGLIIEVGANIFIGGGPDSMVHFYENNDSLFFRIKYNF